MRGYRFLFGMMVWGAASITCAAPLTPAQQAFADAQALAASAQAEAVANVSNGGVAATINQFNPTYYNSSGTAPESALFQNGDGNTISAGQSQISGCQNDAANPDPVLRQNCDAINWMVRSKSARPTIAVPPSLFAASRAIVANAPALATSSLGIADPNAVGAFTGCVNRIVEPPPTMKICSEFRGTVDQQCTVGRVVIVDEFTNYKCDKTVSSYLPQTCDRALTATVTAVNYCSISGSATGLGSYVQTTTTRKWVAWGGGQRGGRFVTTTTSSTVSSPHFDVTFGCSGGVVANVTVTINAGAQCHGGGCNSDYYPITLNFIPGTNAGPVTQNLARVYTGAWWETTTVSYNAATNTVSISNSENLYQETITATAVPSGTAGVRNDISSSWVNGCATQEAAAL
jgi:hypothetical protein